MKVVGGGRRLAEQGLESVPARVVRKFIADNGPNQAVLIAWNVLFSIFPIVLVMAAVLGVILSRVGVQSTAVYQTVLAIVPDEPGRQQALAALEGVRQRTGLFFVLGLAGFVWSGASLFGAMEQTFDHIHGRPQRPFLRQKLMGLLMMLVYALLAGVAIATSSVLPLLKYLPLVPAAWTQSATLYVLQPVVGVLAGVLLFGTVYVVVPNRRQRLADVWPGALLAGVAFYVLTLLFPLYLSFNKNLGAYGSSFAFLFILMTFFYFVGLITVLGAELNAVLQPARAAQPARGRRAPEPTPPPPHRNTARAAVRTALFGAVAAVIGVFAFTRRRRAAG